MKLRTVRCVPDRVWSWYVGQLDRIVVTWWSGSVQLDMTVVVMLQDLDA